MSRVTGLAVFKFSSTSSPSPCCAWSCRHVRAASELTEANDSETFECDTPCAF